MKERPILFSAPMVRAILGGKKTQTRRVVRSFPHEIVPFVGEDDKPTGEFGLVMLSDCPNVIQKRVRCPYGQPGDRLWVREAFHICPHHEDYFYRADDENLLLKCKAHTKWRPSIHMPRRASRITLEITGVRVERLQDISQADARAEGHDLYGDMATNPCGWFSQLWKSINGYDSWHSNPWVWVIEFKKVEAVS